MSALTYTSHGDYLLPDIALNEPPPELTEPLTKYGFMRKSYLKIHRTIFYNQLLLSEQLYPHLRETQQIANERMDTLIAQLAKLNICDNSPFAFNDKAAFRKWWLLITV